MCLSVYSCIAPPTLQRANYTGIVDAMASQPRCQVDKFFHGALTQALAALDEEGAGMAAELVQVCCVFAAQDGHGMWLMAGRN